MQIDRQEKMLRHRKKIKEVDRILREEFQSQPRGTGLCHVIWARKKQLLWELYGIDWKTPAEMNPTTIFD